MEDREGNKVFTVAEFCEKVAGRLHGDGEASVSGVNSMECAGPSEVTFVTELKHVERLSESNAAAALVFGKLEKVAIPQIVVDNVEAALIKALNVFAPKLTVPAGIHPRAVIDETADLGEGVAVGPGACIGRGAKIGASTVIGPGCVIGENTTVGANCRLDANVVVYHNCRIGDNCVILANATIGATGFGYAFIDGRHRLIPHNGGVVIEDCVDIGAGTCVDRAKFGNTVIGAGTKIDNLVQIGHNVILGKCCVLAGQVGISGSAVIGNGVVIAGQAGIRDHLKIGDGARIGARAGLLTDVGPGQSVLGMPAKDAKDQIRLWAIERHLPDVVRQVKKMAGQISRLDEGEKND